eukprot:TRINITY_DN8694_c0_g1_i1.p1 TRINITY_DN8694_c0_g1~~TRINITY_DN8694_c0_g1_i1.p1  ORF type:complete len:407 (-),score=81.91 TRINITY_DN8694_c0_g1_i1:624-1844(-)
MSGRRRSKGGHKHSHSHDRAGSHDHVHAGAAEVAAGVGLGPFQAASQTEMDEEQRHFMKVVASYANYERNAMFGLMRSRKYFAALPVEDQKLLSDMPKRYLQTEDAIRHNAAFLHMFIESSQLPMAIQAERDAITEGDMDKVRSTLKQFVRDWSSEGAAERDACYKPMIAELQKHFPTPSGGIHVLVPGAGLGRLAFDVAKLGYSAQGNEFSYFMLLASNFILNRSTAADCYTIYPFIHQTCNVDRSDDMTRPVQVPDVLPADIPADVDFSMCAGEFVEVYNAQPESFDCVMTCFFIDTAHNIVEYVRCINRVLKPGGVWINFGPLLYHFADMDTESSVEISYEQLQSVVRACGFTITNEDTRVTPYTHNQRAMMRLEYICKFFTAVKQAPAAADESGVGLKKLCA